VGDGTLPATPAEEHVLAHLTAFVGDTEAWALEQVREHEQDRATRERVLDQLRAEAAELDRTRGLVLKDYTAATAEGDPKARYVLEALDRLDGQATALARRVADAEAQISEWQEAGEDEALALLRGLLDAVQGRVAKAQGTAALHNALASVLAGIWLSYEGDRLRAEFRMAESATAPSEAERRRIVHLLQHMEPGDPLSPTPERFTLRGQPRHTPWCKGQKNPAVEIPPLRVTIAEEERS
jgi:hypothetical protein